MFSSTPNSVRRLLSYVKPGASEQSSCYSPTDTTAFSHSSISNAISEEEAGIWVEKAVKSLVKKLKKGNLLEELEKAISNEDPNTKCINIARSLDGRLQIQQRKGLPHVMYCRLWRWPNLLSHHELRHVDHCLYAFNLKKDEVCVNPYHYIRVENSLPLSLEAVPSFQQQQPPPQPPSQQQQQQHQKLPSVIVPRMSSMSAASGVTLDQNLIDCGGVQSSSGRLAPFSPFLDIKPGHLETGLSQYQVLNVPCNINAIIEKASPLGRLSSSAASPFALPTPPPATQHFSSGNTMSSLGSSPTAAGSPLSSCGAGAASPSAYYSEDNADSCCGEQAMDQDLGLIDGHHQSSDVIAATSVAHNEQQQQPQQQHQQQQHLIPLIAQPSPIDGHLIFFRDLDNWCSLHYYELQHRVGDTFHVRVKNVQIDGGTCPSDVSRFCLGSLNNANRSVHVENARRFIGRGIRLIYENGEVTAQCDSTVPIFVQSPSSNLSRDWHPATVCRIPPECNFSIFRNNDFRDQLNSSMQCGYEAVFALTKMCTIRVSFVKGWGAEYRRQTITSTPCWLEIHLNGPLQWLDQVLYAMGSPRGGCSSMS